MFTNHFVYFTGSKTHAGPFMTFQAAFSHIARHQKDSRIELEDGTVLATWSHWTGLYKVGTKYKYLVINNEFNRVNCPNLIGQILDTAPNCAIVQDVEVA